MNGIERFGLSPLIRFTLLSLYGALVLPLPLLAPAESRALLWGESLKATGVADPLPLPQADA